MTNKKILILGLIAIASYIVLYIIVACLKLTKEEYLLTGVGSVFNAFAFIGIAYNLFIQSKRLDTDSNRFDLESNENKESRNTFRLIKILEMFEKFRDNSFTEDDSNCKGINLLKLRDEFQQEYNTKNCKSTIEELDHLQIIFSKVYLGYIKYIERYVELLVNMLNHVDEKMEEETKIFWRNHFKLLISVEELHLLFYYCFKYREHKNILAKYELFEKLDPYKLANPNHKDLLKE
jgi:hypothetical protein